MILRNIKLLVNEILIERGNEKNTKILLLEQSSRLGGRIYTIKNKSQLYESGGARFSNQHHLLMELIKEFKNYLIIERNLSKNTVDSYLFDIEKLKSFFSKN